MFSKLAPLFVYLGSVLQGHKQGSSEFTALTRTRAELYAFKILDSALIQFLS